MAAGARTDAAGVGLAETVVSDGRAAHTSKLDCVCVAEDFFRREDSLPTVTLSRGIRTLIPGGDVAASAGRTATDSALWRPASPADPREFVGASLLGDALDPSADWVWSARATADPVVNPKAMTMAARAAPRHSAWPRNRGRPAEAPIGEGLLTPDRAQPRFADA